MSMEGINGNLSTSAVQQAPARTSEFTPPSGEPAGAPEVQPNVSVAISDAAAARMESMMAPAEHRNGTMETAGANGGVEFGVDMGGFDWPLNADAESTVANEVTSGDDGWVQSSETTAEVGTAASSESAYLALGKSTVNASA